MEINQKARLERALSQRLYLISAEPSSEENWNFEVEGSTGTIYNVQFKSKGISCSCPDFLNRHRICKHIYFIIGRVLKDIDTANKIDKPNIRIFNLKGNLTEELNRTLNPRLNVYKQNQGVEEIPKDETQCPICFEEYIENEYIVRCQVCKKYFHGDCMKVWLSKATRCNCPMCRGQWSPVFNPLEKFQ